MQLFYLKNKDINYKLWDEKIEVSGGYLPYAKSWFLDIVSPRWEALVSENYDCVMPLPVKRKFGLVYLIQPLFTQQLGVFSANIIDKSILNQFLESIPYFSYQLCLNENNFFLDGISMPNYVLSLQKTFADIADLFSKNTIRNIEKAKKMSLSASKLDFGSEIRLFMTENANDSYKHNLSVIFALIEKALEHNAMDVWGVKNQNGDLLATACFHKTKGRLVYVFPVSNSEGKRSSAMFLLLDTIIEHYSKRFDILDFEGSQVETIARFYRGFGAENRSYSVIKKNRPGFLTGKF